MKKLADLVKPLVPGSLWAVLRFAFFRYLVSDKHFVNRQFKQCLGRRPNLRNPKTFNEKLQWLKLNWFDQRAVTCADKVSLREFVAERVGPQYLMPVIGVYSRLEQIPFDTLPDAFALKASHGSGMNIICHDKAQLDLAAA